MLNMTNGKPKVLVVDDYANLLRFAKDILEPDFLVDTALGFADALTKLHEQSPPYDVAILDIRLDDRNELDERGLELLKEIRELGGYTQGVIWTGYETYRTMRKALTSLGAFDYLLKRSPEGTDSLDVRLLAAVQRAAERAYRLKDFPSVPQPRKILIVEMQPQWLERVAESLADKGYEIMTASDCDSAIELLKREYFRLVVVGLGAFEGLKIDEAFNLMAEIRESSWESDIVLLSPFDAAVAQITHTIAQYGVLDVFPKKAPFDHDAFSRFISHTLAPVTQKFLTARLVGVQTDHFFTVGQRYGLQIQCLSRLPQSTIIYTSFPMSPAQSPLGLLARFQPYDMEVHSAPEQDLQVIFDQDTQPKNFEFTVLRPGPKELIVDFYVQPQLRWLRRISLPIEAKSV